VDEGFLMIFPSDRKYTSQTSLTESCSGTHFGLLSRPEFEGEGVKIGGQRSFPILEYCLILWNLWLAVRSQPQRHFDLTERDKGGEVGLEHARLYLQTSVIHKRILRTEERYSV
jgi:hypothetical protein